MPNMIFSPVYFFSGHTLVPVILFGLDIVKSQSESGPWTSADLAISRQPLVMHVKE